MSSQKDSTCFNTFTGSIEIILINLLRLKGMAVFFGPAKRLRERLHVCNYCQGHRIAK